MNPASPSRDLAYLKQRQQELMQSGAVSTADFKSFCQLAIEVKQAHPEDRADIAYQIVCFKVEGKGAEKSIVRQVIGLAMSLEIPDAHVYTGDGLSVVQKWAKLEELVEQI